LASSRYRSPLRDEQANETRRRIREAARAAFEEVGFAQATIADIARRAGVAQPTVYAAYASKAGIVKAMLELLEEDAGLPQAIEAMLREADPRAQLALFVSSHRRLFETGAAILRAAVEAKGDPEVAAFIAAGNAKRRRGIDTLTAAWAAAGALRGAKKKAAESMWLLTTAELYLVGIDQLGWTPAHYERWLREALEHQLLRPAP
jgi:AcrR family transcriptional regulator